MIAIFPKIAECAAQGEVEKLVCLVREYFAGKTTYAPQVDLESIYDCFGIPVTTESSFSGLGAIVAKDDKGQFRVQVILSTGVKEGPEKRFLLAHLLGHYILHIEPQIARGELIGSGYKELACPLNRYSNRLVDKRCNQAERERDNEADRFAAALLLPKGLVKRALAKLPDPEAAAAFFGISLLMFKRRMADLDLRDEPPASFLQAEERLEGEVTGRVFKRDENVPGLSSLKKPAVALEKPLTEKVNRVLANASYNSPQTKPSSPRPVNTQETKPAKPAKKGMERLRELARRIDSSVE